MRRDLAISPSRQIVTRSDGRKQTIYRDTGGEFISKARYDELLKKKPAAQKPPAARSTRVAGRGQEITDADVATRVQPNNIQRNPAGSPSKQIITRSDGQRQTIYRDADGEFISKARFDELLQRKAVAKKPSATRAKQAVTKDRQVADTKSIALPSSQGISRSGTAVSASDGSAALGNIQTGGDVHGVRVGNDVFPVIAPSEETFIMNHQRQTAIDSLQEVTSASNHSEPPLSDFVKGIVKDELPLLHEFLKISVDRLKDRAQASSSSDATSAKSSSIVSSAGTSATADRGGTAVASFSVDGNVAAPVHIGNTTEHHYSPPDPKKEVKNELRKASRKSVLRPEIEEIARKAYTSGRRPALNDFDLSGCHLEKIDLHNADLIGATLEDCHLTGANLRNADLRNANLTKADMTEADMAEANCSNAVLAYATMRDVNLNGANLHQAKLTGAKLAKVNLERSDLRSSDLRGAILQDVHLERSDLSDSDLSGAVLEDVRLQGAILNGIVIDDKTKLDPQCRSVIEVACWEDPDPLILKNAQSKALKGAILRGAHLAGYDLPEADFTGADLTSADLRRANLCGAQLIQTNLYKANLAGAKLQMAKLNYAVLEGSAEAPTDLHQAHFYKADLSNANLRYADLHEADLHEANLSDANLTHADLRNADFTDANLAGANLAHANLAGAKISDQQLAGARDLTGAIMTDGSKHL